MTVAQDGRGESGRIARESLHQASAALSDVGASLARTDLAARLRGIRELVLFLSGPDGPAPREAGHDLLVLLRHAVGTLRRDVLVDTLGVATTRRVETVDGMAILLEGTNPGLDALARAHDAVDTAVTVLGGVADLVEDPDDWLSDPDDEVDCIPGDGFSDTAATAALLVRDNLGLLRRNARPEGKLLTREAAGLVASTLALSCALAVPEGAPRAAAKAVAENGMRSFARFQESLESWRLVGGVFPEEVLDGLTVVGTFACDVFAEVGEHAAGPGNGAWAR